jgi:hypothetical protein
MHQTVWRIVRIQKLRKYQKPITRRHQMENKGVEGRKIFKWDLRKLIYSGKSSTGIMSFKEGAQSGLVR